LYEVLVVEQLSGPYRRHIVGVLIALGLGVFAGCDNRPQRVPVSGTVLIDGKPLTRGFVQVVPADARASSGEIGPDGRFTLTCYDEQDGCVLGTHPVAVIASEAMGSNAVKWHAPKKYQDTTTSGLTVEITEPTESLVINISWEGGKPFIERFEDEGEAERPAPPPNDN
jgi:hypothetical protein